MAREPLASGGIDWSLKLAALVQQRCSDAPLPVRIEVPLFGT